MRSLVVILIALSLPACSLGPDYVRPDTAKYEAWREHYQAAEDSINSTWWKQFGDPELDRMVQTAVRENLDYKIAVARVDQYLGALDSTRSQYFPQIGSTVSGGGQRQDSRNSESYKVTLNASWELDLWGKVRRSSEAGNAQVLSSDAGRRGVLMSLVSSVASGYITLRALDRQLEIARETSQTYNESLNLFKLRFQYGTISQLQVSQAESQYERARQSVSSIESSIRQQENLLSVLLGQAPGPIPRGRSLEQLTPPEIPAGLPSKLLERRPDIIQAEQTLVAANAQIGVAKAAYFPAISLTGILGVASKDLGKLFATGTGIWSLAGTAATPILTFGAISGQVKQAEAQQQQAQFQYQQTVLNSFREVEDALIKTTKGREQVVSQRVQVKALQDYSRLARLQFEAGTANYLQVLDADRSLFSGQLDFVQGQLDTLKAIVSAYKAMGGGWIEKAEKLK